MARKLPVVLVAAAAALALAACTAESQQTSNEKGTTPPVWSSSPAPSGTASGEHGGGHSAGGEATGESLTAELKDPGGAAVGEVKFTKDGDYLQITVTAEKLKPGFHGFHVHQVGKCEPRSVAPTGGEPGDFLSAGGHLQVAGHTGHPASGDLTSIQVREDGSAELTTTTDAFTLDDLKADGGRAVIIHAGPDNFGNIPTRYSLPDGATVPDQNTLNTGDAGGRVACAVVK